MFPPKYCPTFGPLQAITDISVGIEECDSFLCVNNILEQRLNPI